MKILAKIFIFFIALIIMGVFVLLSPFNFDNPDPMVKIVFCYIPVFLFIFIYLILLVIQKFVIKKR